MSEQAPRQRGGNNLFRTVAAVSTAAILLGSSIYGAQAGSAGFYEDDGDTDTGKTVGIAVGSAVGIFLLAGAIDRDRDNDGDSSSDEKSKSAKSGKVEQVRIVPSQTSLGSGDTALVQVQARYQGSSTWKNVTDSAGVRLVSGGLTQVDGSKNAFAVPYGNKAVSGPATVEGTFGGQSATAQLQVN